MESADKTSAWHRVSVNVKPVNASKPPAATLRTVVRLRGELSLSGPVAEDIMMFTQALCRPGRKKWHRGACLGVLPAPRNGISDITEMYLEAFGEPEAGREVFIRTRQHIDGCTDMQKTDQCPRPRPCPIAAHAILSR
jgi:hypothetical protein